MEFVKVMEIKSRICLSRSCSVCPLGKENNGKGKTCGDFMIQHSSETEQILIEWDKAHPVKTFLSDFMEKYPNAPLIKNRTPEDVCPYDLGYVENRDCTGATSSNCFACWNRPLEVQKLAKN